LSADIRKGQGQCYTPQAYFDKEGNTGEINISVTSSSSSKEDIQNFFNSFDRNVNSLKNGTITEAELNKAKSALRIAVYSLFDDEEEAQDEIISRLRNPGGLSSMKDVIKIIDSITVDDIRAAAQYAFSEKPDFLVDASAEVLEANKDYFATLGDIK
jgi:predicted Zn-dependent peptidase